MNPMKTTRTLTVTKTIPAELGFCLPEGMTLTWNAWQRRFEGVNPTTRRLVVVGEFALSDPVYQEYLREDNHA